VVSKAGHEKWNKHRHRHHFREALDSLPGPFFIAEQIKLSPDEFKNYAGSCAVPVEFEGKSYYCLRREYPGEILVEQLGEISGRYFAPPYYASAPAFLREHSLEIKGAANALGLDEGVLDHLIDSGEIDHFVLGGRVHLWRSDVHRLKKSCNIDKIPRNLPVALSGRQATKPAFEEGYRPRTKRKPPHRKEVPPPEQEQLILDDFQIEAAQALREGLSVLVSAPTGNGKTLVAEMLARNVIEKGLGMVYTSPLKALSNQKYRDFKELFGEDAVGLVTGDISINPDAPMLIMTTEIFRNWCLSEPEQLDKTSYVVFDEIHYLDDIERGTTWEESILFAPPHIKFLGLSATVPNVDEMADWISSVRGGNVVVILEKRRRVPLAIRWLLPNGRIVRAKEARKEVGNLVEHNKALRSGRYWIRE